MKARTMKARLIATAVLTVAILAATGFEAAGQEDPNKQRSSKEFLGPTAESIRPYKPAGRDPFKKFVKPKASKKKDLAPRVVGFPPLEMRRAEFRQKVDQARARELPEPDPVMQYLVSELDITGVFRDSRGYGAFVRAQPTGTMFFVRNGARCYNGEVVRIEGDEAETGGAKVMFRELSYVEVNGKQSPQERMVAKAPTVPAKSK